MIDKATAREATKQTLGEYQGRVQARREQLKAGVYNPPVPADLLARDAAEAARDVRKDSVPAVTRNGMDVRDRAPDPEAEAQGGRGGKAKEQKPAQGQAGDGGVQAGQAQVEQRAEGHEPQAGGGDSAVRGQALRVEVYEAESKEAVSELVPGDAVAVTYKRVWKAFVVR
jgi:hypothetical protein